MLKDKPGLRRIKKSSGAHTQRGRHKFGGSQKHADQWQWERAETQKSVLLVLGVVPAQQVHVLSPKRGKNEPQRTLHRVQKQVYALSLKIDTWKQRPQFTDPQHPLRTHRQQKPLGMIIFATHIHATFLNQHLRSFYLIVIINI